MSSTTRSLFHPLLSLALLLAVVTPWAAPQVPTLSPSGTPTTSSPSAGIAQPSPDPSLQPGLYDDPFELYGRIKMSEILFGPNLWDGDATNDEYIELHHHAAYEMVEPVDLSGWMLESQSGGIFVFPEGTQIPADSFLVIAFGNAKGVPCEEWSGGGGTYNGPGDVVPVPDIDWDLDGEVLGKGGGESATQGGGDDDVATAASTGAPSAGTAARGVGHATAPRPRSRGDEPGSVYGAAGSPQYGPVYDGSMLLCAFWYANAFLHNNNDFVILRDAQGVIVDAVGYESGGPKPYGPLYDEAVAVGEWPADQFHPHLFSIWVDDVGIGRDSWVADTNRPDDWYDGLRVGPSPGKDNDNNPLDDAVVGRVMEADGTGIPGAVVSLIGSGLATVADADGAFVLDGVPAGSFDLHCEAPGYTPTVKAAFHKSPHLLERRDFTLHPVDETTTMSGVIGPAGGTLCAPNGLDWILSFPPGALAFDTSITVSAIPARDAPVPHLLLESLRDEETGRYWTGEKLRGFHLQPEGLVFPPSLEPTLLSAYDGELVVVDGQPVRVASHTSGPAVLEAPGAFLDAGGGTFYAVATIPHFSRWGMITPIDGENPENGLMVGLSRTTDLNGDGKPDISIVSQEICPGGTAQYDVTFEVKVEDILGWAAKVWGEVSGSSGVDVGVFNASGTYTAGGEVGANGSKATSETISTNLSGKQAYSADCPDKQKVSWHFVYELVAKWYPDTKQELTVQISQTVNTSVTGECGGVSCEEG